ncbi:MFS transporter [Burkholderia glumae]|uniref:MFS transporter n=2 Tax=Burkholderia glumae TaxID=337 RepID=UPI0001A4A51D|nr:MFS transporter [Burkholderia glumae]ACR32861.1 major facilitator transporter [Burkholderia glumae BGR1]MCM2543917.1 MFS transporter [Burkholderia glumae]
MTRYSKSVARAPGVDIEIVKIYLLRFLFAASNFVMPFATLFVAKYYSFGSATQGYVVMGVSASYLVGGLAGGYLGDKVDTRPLLIGLSALMFASMLGSLLLTAPAFNVAALTLSTVAAGAAGPVLSAYISGVVNRGSQQAVFGNLYLTYNLAIAFVYIVGGFVLDRDAGFALKVFTFMALLSVLGSLVLNRPQARPMVSNDTSVASAPRIPALVLIGFGLFFGLAVLDAQRSYLLPTWLESLDALTAAKTFGMLGIVNACTVIVATKPLIAFVERFSSITNMGIAALLYGIGFGGYFFLHDLVSMGLLAVIWTAGEILAATYMNVIIAESVPESIRSRVFSLIPSLLTIGKIVAIEFAQRIIAWAGISPSWLIYNIVAVGVLLTAMVLGRTRHVIRDE